ncbi:MAG: hypothetical protein ACLR1V_04820 [Coprococcus sp.]
MMHRIRKWSESHGRIAAGGDGFCNGESLYHLLAYLRDSFIDIESMCLLIGEYICVNPCMAKLVILGCAVSVSRCMKNIHVTDCVRSDV